jgi:hypothetical protein
LGIKNSELRLDLSILFSAITKTENIAILILVVVCAFLCRIIIIIRKEDREDRSAQENRAAAIQIRNNVVLDKVADAIIEMRIALASNGVKK